MNQRETEHAIAALLAELEAETGQHVRGIEVQNYDLTAISNDAPMHLRRVCIDLVPIPGSQWQTE